MTHRIKLFFAMTAMAVGPAVFAGPADAQTNARALLQAADQAVGASKVNSMQFTGKGSYLASEDHFSATATTAAPMYPIAQRRVRRAALSMAAIFIFWLSPAV